MPETALASAPATAHSSKNSTPTGRSSGTGTNSTTSTPTSKKKKGGGGDHNDGGSGGLAGLFASLCGGSKAKRAFDESTPPTTVKGTGKPSPMVQQPVNSKALPAAPVTTKQVAPDVEVTTTKRLSTIEPGPSTRADGINSSIGDSSQNNPLASNPIKEEAIVAINGDRASAAPQSTFANHIENQTSEHPTNGHVGNSSLDAKHLAPVVLGGAALSSGAAIFASTSISTLDNVPTENGNAREVQEHGQPVDSTVPQFDELVLPAETHIATGHPLPLEETEGMTSAAVQPPGSGPTFVPSSGPHAHHHHLTPHVTPSHTPVSHTPSQPHSQSGLRRSTEGGVNSENLDKSLLSATSNEHDRAVYPDGVPTNGGVGLGIHTDLPDYSSSNDAHVAAVAVRDEEEDSEKDDTNMYTDGLEADEEFMDEEDRLIRQGGIGIPIGPDGKPAPLLPPISAEHNGRKCLVLDLDETLLHSSFKTMPSADFIVPVEIESQTHNVYVIKRPGVDMFLKAMGEIYEVVVFTASLSKYADPVLDMLDIHKVVKHRLFRESCYNHKGNYVKDLSQLGREIHTSIIIDNSPASYIFHPNNAVPVSTWFNDPHDTELTDLCPFLTDLATVDDVRGVLDGQL